LDVHYIHLELLWLALALIILMLRLLHPTWKEVIKGDMCRMHWLEVTREH